MSMGQFEVDQFDPEPDPDLVCVICHCIFDDPLETPCHHIFCSSCINRWLERRLTCPTCRTRIITEMMDPAPAKIKTQLGLLMIRCANVNNGCRTISLDIYSVHKNNCAYEMLNCTFSNCEVQVLRRDLKEHEQDCEWRQIRCWKDCGLLFPIKERETHNCVLALKDSLAERNRLFEELQRRATELEELTTDLRAQLTDVTRQLNQAVAFRDDMSESWVEDYDYDEQDWESITSQETTVLRTANEAVSETDATLQPVPPENVLEDDVITFNEWLHQIGANEIPEVPALTADTIMPIYNATFMPASASNSTSGVVSADSAESPHDSITSWQDIQDVYETPAPLPAIVPDNSENELEQGHQTGSDVQDGASSQDAYVLSEQSRHHTLNHDSYLVNERSRDRSEPYSSRDRSRSFSPRRITSARSPLTANSWAGDLSYWMERARSNSRDRRRSRSRGHRQGSRSCSRSRSRSQSWSRYRRSRSFSRRRSSSSHDWRSRSRSRSRRRSRRQRSRSYSRHSSYTSRSHSSWSRSWGRRSRSRNASPRQWSWSQRSWGRSTNSSRSWYERGCSLSSDMYTPTVSSQGGGHDWYDDQRDDNSNHSNTVDRSFSTEASGAQHSVYSSNDEDDNASRCSSRSNTMNSDGPSDCIMPKANVEERGGASGSQYDSSVSVIVVSDSDHGDNRHSPKNNGSDSCSGRSRSPGRESPCHSGTDSDVMESDIDRTKSRQSSPAGSWCSNANSQINRSPSISRNDTCVTSPQRSPNRSTDHSVISHTSSLRSPSCSSACSHPGNPLGDHQMIESSKESERNEASCTASQNIEIKNGEGSCNLPAQSGAQNLDVREIATDDSKDVSAAPEDSDSSGEESATERGRPWLASAGCSGLTRTNSNDNESLRSLDPSRLFNYVHGYVEYNLSNFVNLLQETLINQFTAVDMPPLPIPNTPLVAPSGQQDLAHQRSRPMRTRTENRGTQEGSDAPIADVEVPGVALLHALAHSDSESEGDDYVPENDSHSSGDDTISEHLSDVEEESLSPSSDVHPDAADSDASDTDASNHSKQNLSYLMSNSCASDESDSDWSPN